MRFSHFLFNSQSLSKLELDLTSNNESQVILPESMDLPKLTFMSLRSLYFEDGDSVSKLISSCPILESLILRDVWIEDGYHTNVNIVSHKLKHLEINNNDMLVFSHYNMAKIIRLSTPNLISFICKDYMLQEYCLENVSSLVTADIEIVKECNLDALDNEFCDLEISKEGKEKLYPRRMMRFIRALHNVKELTISSPGFLQFLAGEPDLIEGRSPQFCNLQYLKLNTWFTSRRCLLAITYLLNNTSPCLESLYLTSKETDTRFLDVAEKEDGEMELSVSCTLSRLERIEIREVKRSDTEVKFLGLLLMKAPVLEEMVLSFDTSSAQHTASSPDGLKLVEEFSEKLRMLPRASPNVTLVFL